MISICYLIFPHLPSAQCDLGSSNKFHKSLDRWIEETFRVAPATTRYILVLDCPQVLVHYQNLKRLDLWQDLEMFLSECYTYLSRSLYRQRSNPMDPFCDVLIRKCCGYDEICALSPLKVSFLGFIHVRSDSSDLKEAVRSLKDQWTDVLSQKSEMETPLKFELECSTQDFYLSFHRDQSDPRKLYHDTDKTQVQQYYKSVVLGGSFDHLHAGHKILLTMAVWLSSQRVLCGISGDDLLIRKKAKDFLEPIDIRMKHVLDFLNFANSSLFHEVVVIEDVFGPTATGPDFEAIVVSEETQSGADQINSKRRENQLKPLAVHSISVISTTYTPVEHPLDTDQERKRNRLSYKLGSTFIREWLMHQSMAKKE